MALFTRYTRCFCTSVCCIWNTSCLPSCLGNTVKLWLAFYILIITHERSIAFCICIVYILLCILYLILGIIRFVPCAIKYFLRKIVTVAVNFYQLASYVVIYQLIKLLLTINDYTISVWQEVFITVEPVVSGTILSGHPVLGSVLKSQNLFPLTTVIFVLINPLNPKSERYYLAL